MRGHCDNADTGFTLIELVIVIGLIAIIGSLTISRIDSISSWKHQSDVRQFANLWGIASSGVH